MTRHKPADPEHAAKVAEMRETITEALDTLAAALPDDAHREVLGRLVLTAIDQRWGAWWTVARWMQSRGLKR